MAKQNFKYLDIVTAFFVAVLLISNIADTKAITIGFLSFGGGTFLFPIAYIFGDILTEVYGFKRARRIIWIGFAAEILMAVTFMLVAGAPASRDYPFQQDFVNILGMTPRITAASLVAYFFGEYVNSVMLAKLKVITRGKYLWVRTIGSTIVGELLDTSIFMFIAFFGVFPIPLIFSIIISGYLLKVATEIAFTPLTYWVVNKLKKAEQEDYFDRTTTFTPFAIETK